MTRRFALAPEAVPGFILLLAAATAMLLLNSPLAPVHHAVTGMVGTVSLAGISISLTFAEWVKNLLMAIFFFHAGLDLKREMREGSLSSAQKALLPFLGAIGGVVTPALLYLVIAGTAYPQGWAVPTATDIAFALAALSLLGPRVPVMLKAFLLGVAVIDDLFAILIIAFFYSGAILWSAFAGAALLFAAMVALNLAGISRVLPYVVLAVPLWVMVQLSGINPTVAGVLAASVIPMRNMGGEPVLGRVEHRLSPYVSYGILPIFALTTAGATFSGDVLSAITHPVSLGIAIGLMVGKPVGIALATLAGSRLLGTSAPGNLTDMLGLGAIAGIGFTMSIFVGKLAFPGGEIDAVVKLGVYGGSIVSAIIGLLILGRRYRA